MIIIKKEKKSRTLLIDYSCWLLLSFDIPRDLYIDSKDIRNKRDRTAIINNNFKNK